MKALKRLLCMMLVLFSLVSFCACGETSTNTSQQGSQTINDNQTEPKETEPKEAEPKETVKSINVDLPTQIGNVAEITIANVFSTSDVIPPKPSSFYTHYEASSGCVYFVVVMDVKNLGANSVSADEIISATLVIGDATYDAITVVETEDGASLDRGSSTYIDALEVVRIYQMYSIPNSADTDIFKLSIKNGDEIYTSDFSLSHFESKVKKVNIGDTITDEDTISLTIDSIAFKNSLYPPKASGYYHYYEAANGKTYLIVKMTVTNLKGTDMKYDSIAGVSCVYNEKYNYSFFAVLEEDGGQDLNGYPGQYAIAPLDKGVVYYLAEVPAQVADGPVEITFYIAGNYYSFSL